MFGSKWIIESVMFLVLILVSPWCSQVLASDMQYNALLNKERGERDRRETKVCRHKKRSGYPPEFIHIPKSGGGFVEELGMKGAQTSNGSTIYPRWGIFADWPEVDDYSS